MIATPIEINKHKILQLTTYIKSILKEINETNNLDLLNENLYWEIIHLSQKAFGKCRAAFINLNLVDWFLDKNGWNISYVDKSFREYNYLRNKPGNGCLKIMKQTYYKPDRYYKLSNRDKNIYDNYQILNNEYVELFFKRRDNSTKNIVNKYDKTKNLYIIIHHTAEINNLYDNEGKIINNLSDINIVLNKKYHKYQRGDLLVRCDSYIHTFLHLICFYINQYKSDTNLNLFKAVSELAEIKEKGLEITEKEFTNSSIRNHFTDYEEFQYMLNKYSIYDLKLLSTTIEIVRNKLKETQRINNEK